MNSVWRRLRDALTVMSRQLTVEVGPDGKQVKGKIYNLQDYLKRQNVSGMLVLKNGHVAYKYLGEGNTDSTLWTSRSVGKSVVSALVGVAIKEGKIHSLDDLITQYEPDLKGTAWDGVTLRQLITHTSGVA